MAKYSTFVLAILVFFSNCFADTFINRQTGERFNGYAIQKKRGNKTQVRIEKKSPQYLNLRDYEIHYNHLGRKNKVFVFSIKGSVELICETEAFEKAIVLTANQGPLFILIEIDTPGGRVDLAQRICAAIIKTNNCRTVAFVSGDKFGGAFSAGVIIALACNKVYMRRATAIGAAAAYIQTASGPKEFEEVYGQQIGEKFNSVWSAYCSAIAERNNRPGLVVKAMVNKDIEVVEVAENGKRLFIDPKDKDPNQSVVRTCSSKGSLLTLTAVEAVRAGIADKVVASREELFIVLDASKAARARDTRVFRARKNFERMQRTMEKNLSSIRFLERDAAAISMEIEVVEREIRIIGGFGYRDDYERLGLPPNWLIPPEVNIDELEDALAEYEGLSEQLLDVLEDAIVNYRKALSVAQKHPDLHKTATGLAKGLDSAQSRYDRTRSRLRLFYDM